MALSTLYLLAHHAIVIRDDVGIGNADPGFSFG
jgi:hypothetical protein